MGKRGRGGEGENGGQLETAVYLRPCLGYEKKLYDRRSQDVQQEEIKRIRI